MSKLVVDFKYEDLKKLIYWIILKFKEDEFHHQSSSVKSDLIGGFLDRWFNRASEFLIFQELLKDKNYDIVIDNYLYGQDTQKNAPDVIGLYDKKSGDVLAKFTEFVDGRWEHIKGMPFIEVKTNRKTQSLIAVGETQMDENHYYLLAESNVRDDYLVTLFDKSLFDKKVFDSLLTKEDFIKSDSGHLIINPKPLEYNEELGFFKLLGIFTGKEVKKYSVYARGKNGGSDAEKPYYYAGAEVVSTIRGADLEEQIKEGPYWYVIKDEKYVPFVVKYLEKNSEIKYIKKNKGNAYIRVKGKVQTNDDILKDGDYKINFKKFDRSSGKSEFIGDKHVFEYFAEDSTEYIKKKFDEIIK